MKIIYDCPDCIFESSTINNLPWERDLDKLVWFNVFLDICTSLECN